MGWQGRARLAAAVLGLLVALGAGPTLAQDSGAPWYEVRDGKPIQLNLYFFWSRHCPHCERAQPVVAQLAISYPWLRVHAGELSESADNRSLYQSLANALGQEAKSVPAFLFCGHMWTGFDSAATTGRALQQSLERCWEQVSAASALGDSSFAFRQAGEAPLLVPVLGEVDWRAWSLPSLTVLLAALDSFNPCAFFVLLFLLSLLVHAGSRPRMLLIGGIFVLFSGGLYFLFMAAWLNVFLWLGEARLMTVVAGVIAVAIGGLNVKDYFWFGRGASLSMSESQRYRLIDRMRRMLRLDSVAAMLGATVVLAVLANSYELLCTAGFPMVFTRILTLNDLDSATYYGYIALYNVVYVLPLLIIVLVFSASLGSRKLSERGARTLKLLSGCMMFALGLVLLVAPGALSSLFVAVAIPIAALAVTGGITWVEARRTLLG